MSIISINLKLKYFYLFIGDVPRVGDIQRGQQQRDGPRPVLCVVKLTARKELLHLHPGCCKRHRVR